MSQPEKQVKWRGLIAEQKESGQSVAAFCRRRGVREALYYYWKKQLQKVGRTQFVELQVAKPDLSQRQSVSAQGATIEVRLGNGRSLMVAPEFKADHLRALLAVLESES
jgi:transposase-like protein